MNKRRDDETEPMTRMLGTVVVAPRENEPHKRLANLSSEQTRLEIARPKIITAEPPTQIIHRTSAPPAPALSLDTATVPALPPQPRPQPQAPVELQRDSPPGPIRPVFAPRLSQADQDEITASRAAPHRRTPFFLAIALVLVCFATGASLLRARAMKRRAQAAAPAAAVLQPEQAQPEVRATAPETEPKPQALPEAQSPEPTTESAAPEQPTVEDSIDELEKRAVDRLQNNDHEAALAAYTELSRRQPKQEAYSVMVTLLTRRVQACQGDPSCAR